MAEAEEKTKKQQQQQQQQLQRMRTNEQPQREPQSQSQERNAPQMRIQWAQQPLSIAAPQRVSNVTTPRMHSGIAASSILSREQLAASQVRQPRWTRRSPGEEDSKTRRQRRLRRAV